MNRGSVAVITEPCIAVCDTACVDACPVDCIHGPVVLEEIRAIPNDERPQRLGGIQMYVNPQECIGCWLCITACPVQAIFQDVEVPEDWQSFIGTNARFFEKAPNH
jgi:NAD-dependent dihydropyrimidine dehydrogenase PreA subunit